MPVRRTTLAAERDDLALLKAEAQRRGVSLAQVLRDTVAAEAARLRKRRRPRFAIARSERGAARAAGRDEDAPARTRRRT